MKQLLLPWSWFIKQLLYLLVATVLAAGLLSVILAQAQGNGSSGPAWAAPTAMAIRRASSVANAQSTPNFLDNLDCSLVTYRLVGSGTMQTGCFTETVFGLMDSDSDTVIFNGTDEGLPLLGYGSHDVLIPWPGSLDLIVLNALNTGGSSISLYKNPLAAVQDQRNLFGRLIAKQLTGPPELPLKDAAGQQLVINPETLAFSDGGSWLVAETLGGSFVRINLATLDVTAFAPSFGAQGSPGLLKSRVAVSDDGHYVAIWNDATSSFKVYDLTTCSGASSGLQPQTCLSYDYRAFAGQQIAGLQYVRRVRFINDDLLSFEATASNPANSGIYELAPTASITSLTDYIGLGDSYTSGEGAFDYLAGTDSDADMCHLSRRSYPLLLTRDLFSSAGGHSVACSGAVINDVSSTSDNYRGQVRGVGSLQQLQQTEPLLLESVETNFIPGYVAQQRFVKRWQPRVATVSVGGDDIGFGDLVLNCVMPHVSRHVSDSTCYNTYEDRLELQHLIDRTVPRWTALYNQLQRAAPAMQLYAIGYPQVIDDTGSCALNVQLSKSELEFASSLIDYLNQAIQKAAAAAGVPYVDISQALKGHRLCEAASYAVAVNGLTAGRDGGPLGTKIFGKESYHPNALGQALIEQTILQQTHNLTVASPSKDGPTDASAPLLNAPKSGRTVSTRIPAVGLAPSVAKRGSEIAVRASGPQTGLQPKGAIYTIQLDGPTGPILGITSRDDSGNIDITVTIPDTAVPGGHTIDITGPGQVNEPIDITQPIYVPYSDNDSDGDTIPDILDTCPGAINSGRDTDQDGVDDICDNLIGPPPDTLPPSGNQSGSSAPASSSTPTPPSSSLNALVSPNLSPGPVLRSAYPTIAASLVTRQPYSQPNNRDGTVRSLGAATVNPDTVKRPVFQPVSASRNNNPPLRQQVLRVIHWLPWAILVIICLVILLAAERYTKSAKFQLQ